MTTNVVVIHGTCGSPEGNWFPWMKAALEEKGARVFVPAFPTPEGQSFEAWRRIFIDVRKYVAPEDTILIGHSIGAPFIAAMAEEAERPYRAAFAVCPFAAELGNEDFDKLNDSFVNRAFDWDKASKGAQKWICYAGSNDPYVPTALSEDVALKLGADLRVIEKGGHLNEAAGYTAFPALLDEVAGYL